VNKYYPLIPTVSINRYKRIAFDAIFNCKIYKCKIAKIPQGFKEEATWTRALDLFVGCGNHSGYLALLLIFFDVKSINTGPSVLRRKLELLFLPGNP
jgi:hypothetical protein